MNYGICSKASYGPFNDGHIVNDYVFESANAHHIGKRWMITCDSARIERISAMEAAFFNKSCGWNELIILTATTTPRPGRTLIRTAIDVYEAELNSLIADSTPLSDEEVIRIGLRLGLKVGPWQDVVARARGCVAQAELHAVTPAAIERLAALIAQHWTAEIAFSVNYLPAELHGSARLRPEIVVSYSQEIRNRDDLPQGFDRKTKVIDCWEGVSK